MTNVSSETATGLPAAPPPPPRRKTKAPPSRRRALMLYHHVPSGYEVHLVHTGRFAPHIKAGESIVVDTTDREPVAGEIFLVKVNSPLEPEGFARRLVQLSRRPEGWMLHFSTIRCHGRRLSTDEIVAKLRTGKMTVRDGPLRDNGMRGKIIGRVVGLMQRGTKVIILPDAEARRNDVLAMQAISGSETAQLMLALARHVCRSKPDALGAAMLGFDVAKSLERMGQLSEALAAAHATVGLAMDRLKTVSA